MVLSLMVTKQCNFHCGHCMIDSSHEFSCVSEEVVEKWFNMLYIGKPDAVYLVGGEPLLHIDLIEKIVERTKPVCDNIVIFTNGTFLLDSSLKKRVEDLKVTIRISSDKYHRMQWSEELKTAINASSHLIIDKPDDKTMIPVGRAYEEFKHIKKALECSLLTGIYDETYKDGHRYMVLMDGRVNLYCATIEAELANVFEDEIITYDMLVEREKILHNYLYAQVIHCEEDKYMAKMCNLCPHFKVTDSHILLKGEIIAYAADYREARKEI